MEESKQADITTGQAAHRISKGIYDKVLSVSFDFLKYVRMYVSENMARPT